MTEVVLASGNRGKLRELARVLSEYGMHLRAQSEFGVEGPPETAVTFVENALTKARHAARITGLPAIADDSGLEVEVLGGAPGVYSARFAGPTADDAANNARLLRELEGVPVGQRQARFRALIVYLRHADDPAPIIAEGTWSGAIATQEKGGHGFGYDPLFLLPDGRSAAELDADEKGRVSHRGQALRKLAEKLAA